MRNLHELDRYRVTHPARLQWTGGWAGDDSCGAFEIRSQRSGHILRVIASSGENWDHVSVSLEKRVPNWYEMEQVKRLFFYDHEVAMQLHLPPSRHINIHPNCLHLWRPHWTAIPQPPSWMVGPQTKEKTDGGKASRKQEQAEIAGETGRAESAARAAAGTEGGCGDEGVEWWPRE